jgi:hypothetical protein
MLRFCASSSSSSFLFIIIPFFSLSLSLVPWLFFFSFSSFFVLQKMKVIESRPNGPSTVFGLVVLPLNSKHTAGCAVALNISDEFMNIKGSLQLAAKWEVALPLPPRQVLVELMSANDLPTRSNVSHVACRVRNKQNETQVWFSFLSDNSLSFFFIFSLLSLCTISILSLSYFDTLLFYIYMVLKIVESQVYGIWW